MVRIWLMRMTKTRCPRRPWFRGHCPVLNPDRPALPRRVHPSDLGLGQFKSRRFSAPVTHGHPGGRGSCRYF